MRSPSKAKSPCPPSRSGAVASRLFGRPAITLIRSAQSFSRYAQPDSLSTFRFQFGFSPLERYYLPYYVRAELGGFTPPASNYQLLYIFDGKSRRRTALEADVEPGRMPQQTETRCPSGVPRKHGSRACGCYSAKNHANAGRRFGRRRSKTGSGSILDVRLQCGTGVRELAGTLELCTRARLLISEKPQRATPAITLSQRQRSSCRLTTFGVRATNQILPQLLHLNRRFLYLLGIFVTFSWQKSAVVLQQQAGVRLDGMGLAGLVAAAQSGRRVKARGYYRTRVPSRLSLRSGLAPILRTTIP